MSSANTVRIPGQELLLPVAAPADAAVLNRHLRHLRLRRLIAVTALVLGCWALLSVVAEPARADASATGREHSAAAGSDRSGRPDEPAEPDAAKPHGKPATPAPGTGDAAPGENGAPADRGHPAGPPADPGAPEPRGPVSDDGTGGEIVVTDEQPGASGTPDEVVPVADPGASRDAGQGADEIAESPAGAGPVEAVVRPAVEPARHVATPGRASAELIIDGGDAGTGAGTGLPADPETPPPAPVPADPSGPADSSGGSVPHSPTSAPLAALFAARDPIPPPGGRLPAHPRSTGRVIHGADDPGSRPG